MASASVVCTTSQEAPTPLHTFPVQDVFVWRHEQGTLIEKQNEEQVLKRFNERRHSFKAWPISSIPGLATSFSKSWLLLVQVPNPASNIAFPSLTDRFTIDMGSKVERPDGIYSLIHLPATRIQNPYENLEDLANPGIQKCAALKVDVPRSWKNNDGDYVELDLMATFQTASAIDDVSNINLNAANHQPINILFDTFSLTFEAELAALRYLVEDKRIEERRPGHKSLIAFKTIQDFHNGEKTFYDLHHVFPHLVDPENRIYRIPKFLRDKYREFNADHRSAYAGLTRIPNGLYFVNGCPGAGKTEWNMVVAALIQCQRRPASKRRHSPILFLVDINQTVDDAADRYFDLCKAAGLTLRIVRMHGWPYEMRNSEKLSRGKPSDASDKQSEVDFTKRFLTTASLAKLERNRDKAPTLDEASWDYYERYQDDCFVKLKKLLVKMDSGVVLTMGDWKVLRGSVRVLYKAVLAQTDFIATTPTAAYGSFSKMFRPDIIFVDEAPHARELTTLIPIAYFEPIAWIFTGDVNQTRPFVKSEGKSQATREGMLYNPYADQLRLSTMARAALVDAINSKLLVNKRAYGNLHRLPSKLFYGGRMVSGHDASAQYPPSTLHLRKYLERLGGGINMTENRVVVRLKKSCEENHRNSFWNPAHHHWLMEKAKELLEDSEFVSISKLGTPGTIMIATPYSAAMRQYQAEAKQWPQEWQDRVQILTVDRAQGNQADVVFLDTVRSSKAGFMDDPRRLNVAITRARQAELILMHYQMTWKPFWGQRVRSSYTSQIWDDTLAEGRILSL